MDKKSFILKTTYVKPLDMLTDEEVGKLFRAIFAYESKTPIDICHFNDNMKLCYQFITQDLDRYREKYAESCIRNAAKAKELFAKNSNANEADIDIGIDTDIDNDTGIDNSTSNVLNSSFPTISQTKYKNKVTGYNYCNNRYTSQDIQEKKLLNADWRLPENETCNDLS